MRPHVGWSVPRAFSRSAVRAAVFFGAAVFAVAQAPGSYVGWSAAGTASYNPFSPQAVDGWFGGAVAIVGDLNGDGVDDVLVQAGAGAFLHKISGATGALIGSMTGVVSSEFGRAVARMPDVDGDAVPDFVVGSPGHGSPGFSSIGRVQLLSGSTGAALWTVLGVGTNARLGETVAEIGDVDFDGVPDVGVGAPGGFGLGFPTTFGYALVLSGATGATIRSYASPPGLTVGRAIAKVGDVDQDGVVDALFTATNFPTGGPTVCGSAFAAVMSGLTGAPIFSVSGPLCDNFGYAAAGVGDATGDGVPDFAVAAPASGVVSFFSGLTGAVYATTSTTTAGAYYGAILAGPFDFDGDGDPDLAVGSPEYSVVGGASGRVVVVDAGTGAAVATLLPHAPSTFSFGQGLAVGGDLGGDGIADVFVGAPQSSNGPFAFNGIATVRTRYGLAAGGSRFGSGCAGGLSVAPRLNFVGGGPNVSVGASAFGLAVTAAPPFSDAILMIGLSNTTWTGGSLPFGLAALGLPTCQLLVSPDLFFFAPVAGGGAAIFPFPLAPTPSISGLPLFAQAYVATPFAPLSGGATAGLAVVLQ